MHPGHIRDLIQERLVVEIGSLGDVRRDGKTYWESEKKRLGHGMSCSQTRTIGLRHPRPANRLKWKYSTHSPHSRSESQSFAFPSTSGDVSHHILNLLSYASRLCVLVSPQHSLQTLSSKPRLSWRHKRSNLPGEWIVHPTPHSV